MPDSQEASDRGRWCPELAGRTAIVTGAGRHLSIGRQIALELARQGVNVVLTGTGRDPSRYPEAEKAIGWRDIDSVVAEVEAAGGAGLALISDVSDPDGVDQVVAAAIERFGAVDILINNASAAVADDRVPLHEIPIAEWRRVLGINLDGALYMARAVAAHMVERGEGGTIVNISSTSSRSAPATAGAYVASKAGLEAMSRVMAMELAQHRIRVNAVLPGLVLTSRVSWVSERPDWDDFVKGFTPMGVASDGTDIAHMCAYLCSDMGRWVTGQNIAVDGGTSWR